MQNVRVRSWPSFHPNPFSHFLPCFLDLLKSAAHSQPTSSSLQARCQISFKMAQVIFPLVLGLNRLLQVVCEKKMTVLICFLEIKRLVWKPVIIKDDVPGGLGSRGQRLRPLAGHFLAWGDINWPWGRQPASTPHSASLLWSPLSKAPTQVCCCLGKAPASPSFPDSETELPL